MNPRPLIYLVIKKFRSSKNLYHYGNVVAELCLLFFNPITSAALELWGKGRVQVTTPDYSPLKFLPFVPCRYEGLLVFEPVFRFLESALDRHKDSLLGELDIEGTNHQFPLQRKVTRLYHRSHRLTNTNVGIYNSPDSAKKFAHPSI